MSKNGLISATLAVGLCAALFGYGIKEELRVGVLEGKVISKATGKPLGGATMIANSSASGDSSELGRGLESQSYERRVIRADAQGNFRFDGLPEGTYTLSAYSRSHSIDYVPASVLEGKSKPITVKAEPNVEEAKVYVSQRVFLPDEKPRVHLSGYSPSTHAKITVFQVPDKLLQNAKTTYELLSPLADRTAKGTAERAKLKKVADLDHKIVERDGEGVFNENVELKPMQPGAYLATLSLDKVNVTSFFLVTRIGLTTKLSGNQFLGYVTDLKTGQPVSNAEVSLLENGQRRQLGSTSESGVLQVALPPKKAEDGYRYRGFVAGIGDERAYCLTEFWVDSDSSNSRMFGFTDRPIYRPGDVVHFKAIYRDGRPGNYRPAAGRAVEAEVRDPNDQVVQKLRLTTSGEGNLVGTFTTLADVVGNYSISLKTINGQQDSIYVPVQAYRKPEFKITVEPTKKRFRKGDRIEMDVRCEYYFGGPVAGATIDTSVFRKPHWNFGDDDDLYTWYLADYEDEYSYDGEYVDSLSGVTDDTGVMHISYDPDSVTDEEGGVREARDELETLYGPGDYEYTFNVSGSESGDKYFDGKGSAVVVQGGYSLTLLPDRYLVAPGDDVTLEARVFDQETDKPQSGKSVEFEIYTEEWVRNRARTKSLGKATGTTDANGVAHTTLKASVGGNVIVRARVKDDQGAEITANDYLWVSGYAESARPLPKLEVRLDKRGYSPGESAEVMIQTNKPGGTALVTLETSGIVSSQVVKLDSPVVTTKVSTAAVDDPRATISVVRMFEKEYSVAEKSFRLSTAERNLNIVVTPNSKKLLPGQTVSYDIEAKDASGKPVSTELAMSVVDGAIYDIREDSKDPLKTFYRPEDSGVNTFYSFQEVFLDGGDKGEGKIQVRSKFLDTAYWNPTIKTDANGHATVSVPLPDNITTWRATVTGVTSNALCGKVRSEVRVAKPLMVRLSMPTYVTMGDEVQVSALVTNTTDQSQTVEVKIDAGPLVTEDLVQQIEVKAGSTKPAVWTLKASQMVEQDVTVTAIGQSSKDSDGVKLPLIAQAPGADVSQNHQAIVVDENADEWSFDIPEGSYRSDLNVKVQGSVLSLATSSLDELIDYPYGCTEQTMSRFVPAVLVTKVLRERGISTPEIEAKLPKIIQMSFAKLFSHQQSSGGFSWFANGEADRGMTAIALEGLYKVSQAGVAVPKQLTDRAVEFSLNEFKTLGAAAPDKYESSQILHMASATLLYKQSEDIMRYLSRIDRNQLSMTDRVTLAMAMYRVDQPEWRTRAIEFVNLAVDEELAGTVKQGAYEWGAEREGRLLEALSTINPTDPRVVELTKRLALKRTFGGWTSTRDTATAVVAIAKAFGNTQAGALQATVWLNGESIETITLSSQDALGPGRLIKIPADKLKQGTNTLKITRDSSTGEAIAAARLTTNVSNPKSPSSEVTMAGGFYSLRVDRTDPAAPKLVRANQPQTQFKSGDVLRYVLHIKSDHEQEYVMVKVPKPSNFKVEDDPDLDYWSYWYNGLQVFDDHVAVFFDKLPKGESWLEINMRAEAPGKTIARSASLECMYQPSYAAFSEAINLDVEK